VPAARESYLANCDPATLMDDRDIRLVQPDEIRAAIGGVAVDVLEGSPPCFAAGTMILTRRGLVPIEEVREGDMVVTHTGRWRPVTGISSREAWIIAARGHGHPGIKTTADHPFYVRHLAHRWDPARKTAMRSFAEPVWRGIGECLPNGLLAGKAEAWFWGMRRTYPEDIIPDVLRSDARGDRPELSPEFFWLVGLWLGDGWLRTGPTHVKPSLARGEVLICAAKDQADVVRHAIAAAGLGFSEAEMRTTIRFTICNSGLAEWLEEDFGRGAGGKTVPYWAFGMRPEWRKALLDGYIFADGHRYGGEESRISSISWPLILGMAMIARSLGLATTVRSSTRTNNTQIENRIVNVAGAVYALDINDRPRSFLVEEEFCWGRIKEITQVGPGVVYNLHVEEDESYVADGLIVHNCAAFSTAGKRAATWDQVRSYSDVKQRTDDLFFEFARILDGLLPRAFVAENVSGLLKGVAKGYFIEILTALKRPGYRVKARLLDAQWLGVPQARQRVIFVGIREDLGLEPEHPQPLAYRYSLREACPWIVRQGDNGGFGEGSLRSSDHPSPTVGAGPQTGNGRFPASLVEATRVASLDRPVRTIDSHGHDAFVESETDISRYAIGREAAAMREGGHSDRYLNLQRAHRDKPAPTVTAMSTSSAATSIHPTELRRFSIAELKRICSFPDDFEFPAKSTYAQQWERLGRSVPPLMMRSVAATLKRQLLSCAG